MNLYIYKIIYIYKYNMVKNLRGGNKAKKRKNSSGDNSHRALKIKSKNSSSSDAQLYGKSLK